MHLMKLYNNSKSWKRSSDMKSLKGIQYEQNDMRKMFRLYCGHKNRDYL